jgi:hypothetical protein
MEWTFLQDHDHKLIICSLVVRLVITNLVCKLLLEVNSNVTNKEQYNLILV